MATDIESVKRFISLGLNTAGWITKVIPGDADDKLLVSLEALSAQPWFADLIVYVLALFEKNKNVTLGEIASAVTEFKSVSGDKYN